MRARLTCMTMRRGLLGCLSTFAVLDLVVTEVWLYKAGSGELGQGFTSEAIFGRDAFAFCPNDLRSRRLRATVTANIAVTGTVGGDPAEASAAHRVQGGAAEDLRTHP